MSKIYIYIFTFVIFIIQINSVAQTNYYDLTFGNNQNFTITCGTVNASGWTVTYADNDCFLYTPILSPVGSGNIEIPYIFRINQSGGNTINDTLKLEVNVSNTGWTVIQTVLGNQYNEVNYEIEGSITVNATDFLAFRLHALVKTSTSFWTVKKTNSFFTVENVDPTDDYLPVSLASFSGFCENNLAHIEWITYSELNNDYFTIERSENNRDFFAAGYIPGSGNSNIVQHYSFTDSKEIFSEITYYRLRQTDYDGTTQISNSIAVRKNNLQNQQMSYFIENSTVYLNYETLQEEDIKLEVFDIFGKQIDAMLLQAGKGANIVQWSFRGNDAVHGLYFMRIINSSSQIHFAKVVL